MRFYTVSQVSLEKFYMHQENNAPFMVKNVNCVSPTFFEFFRRVTRESRTEKLGIISAFSWDCERFGCK